MNENACEESDLLHTSRLILRRWQVGNEIEISAQYSYATNPDVTRASGWAPYDDIEECRAYHDKVQAPDPECFAIILKQTGMPIGSIAFKPLPQAQKLPDGGDPAACREVGFWLGEPHWGRRFMPEALGAMLRYGFEELGLDTVYARHFLDNTRSRILLEHCGFAYDHTEYDNSFPSLGEIRDEDVLALTAQSWRERRKQLNVPDAPKHIGSGAYWGSDPTIVKRPQC
ncbi:GNAT family N-acetyltransferase [Bifidobacterium tibiigranuli]|jgi:RimJ/RimL family protein N-acetyltransferase|uniref:GNAT family N-acetyltransferase n=1 Tax=Bifidobacterium tibiigranuli TaxID=2172043 RepID=UPI0026EC84F4|nr:GNAT family N-acetyltransferase [Bifidobacterium tibiigranuli]MCI1650718.1 GNAT family N-acetyltransferase [Bifidobacterium tibiigranuli]MCI2185266.1 GNAT family N-acetyltransferase [Bifidobacterium tibiigranuli]MCI2203169.1 GNAT family N-acetyltransferase [Bifidobacterium tibiigranuli]